MTTTTTDQIVHIPVTLYRRAKQAAEQTGVSIEEFVRERLEEALGIDLSPDDVEELKQRAAQARAGTDSVDESEVLALLDEQRARHVADD